MPKMLKRTALSFATLLIALFVSLIAVGNAYADEVAMTLSYYDGETAIGEQQAEGQYFEIAAPVPENENMTFCGWTDDIESRDKVYHSTNIVDITTLSTFDGQSAKLYAVWGSSSSESFYAKYDGADIYSDTECTDKAATPIPTCPGYEFLGYYAEPECITLVIGPDGNFAAENIEGYVKNGNWAMTQNITLYAGWKQIDRFDAEEVSKPIEKQFENMFKYSIDFESNVPEDENKIPSVEKESTLADETLQIPIENTPTREGFDFVAWNTEADGSGIAYQPGDVIELQRGSPGAVLYAIWAVHLNNDQDEVAAVYETFTVDENQFQATADDTWKAWIEAQDETDFTIVKETAKDGEEIETVAIIDDEGNIKAIYDEQGNKIKATDMIIAKNKDDLQIKYTTQLPKTDTEQIATEQKVQTEKTQANETANEPANENTQTEQGVTVVLETNQNTTE